MLIEVVMLIVILISFNINLKLFLTFQGLNPTIPKNYTFIQKKCV